MIVVRNVFRLKFGKAREAIAAWNEYLVENKLIAHPVNAADVIYAGAPKP